MAKKLLDKTASRLAEHLKKVLLGTPVELALIEAVRTAVSEATQQVWPDSPIASQWRNALLERDAVTWPLLDGTDLADLPAAVMLWVAQVDHPLDADGRPEHLDPAHPLVAPLCQEILTAVRHNAVRGDGRLKGLWDDFRIHQLGTSAKDDELAHLRRQSFDPVIVFLADFEHYLEGFGDGVAGLKEFLARIPDGMWPIIDTVADHKARQFIDAHGLGQVEVFGYDSPLEALAFLLTTAWEIGYFMYQFRRYDRIPRPSGTVDPLAIMDRMVEIEEGATGPGNTGVEIEVFLQKAASLRTEPPAIRRTYFAPFTDDDLERILEPRLDQWAETLRTTYAHGLLAANIEHELRQA